MIDVKKIANLARLYITPEEEKEYQGQLESIFGYFEQIAKVETTGIEPLVTPSDIEQHLRKDEVLSHDGAEEALANAPEKSGHLFKVPPVV